MTEKIKLFLADDHALVREGIAAMLADKEDMEVVGQCGDGPGVIDGVARTRPNVVILDLGLPGLHGLDICRQVSRKGKGVAVLVVTMHDDEEFMVRALANGARGYLLKESASVKLVEAIRTVARGDIYLGDGVPQRIMTTAVLGRAEDPYDALTACEQKVFYLIARGKTSRQAAEVLGRSVKTVETHRAHIMRKLGLHNHAELIMYAVKRGML